MNKVGIAFTTRNQRELRLQTMPRVTMNPGYDLHIVDGSDDVWRPVGNGLKYYTFWANVRGGADAAIVFSLSLLLQHEEKYTHVGLVEQDVLLLEDWFPPTMALFERGTAEGLEVGAVSARAYEDRILAQRDGFALMHNLGAGCIILTRQAAELALRHFRTTWTMENRRTFMQLSGVDIGRYWAFRTNEQWLCADWGIDKVLAQHGLASLALTPSKCEMIGQIPPLHEQGLKLVTEPVEALRNDKAFATFVDRTRAIRDGNLDLGFNHNHFHQADDGSWTIFPHQVADIGGKFNGDWKLKWAQGFGPFAWRAGDGGEYPFSETPPLSSEIRLQRPTLTVPVSGPCSFMVSGGESGGQVEVEDLASGYKVTPALPPEGQSTQLLNLVVPGGVTYREIRLTMLTPRTAFYGLVTREQQPWLPQEKFDHSRLPPV